MRGSNEYVSADIPAPGFGGMDWIVVPNRGM